MPGRDRRPGPAPDAAPAPDVPVYVISVAAELTGLHPQTLRTYDRLGLVSPGRTGGGGRRYSWRDIELLREVAELTATGIGLEGVRRILELEAGVARLCRTGCGSARTSSPRQSTLCTSLWPTAEAPEPARRTRSGPAVNRSSLWRRRSVRIP